MKLLYTVLLAGALTVAACKTETERFTDVRRAAVADEVLATLDAYGASINSADFDMALTFYSEDSRFFWAEDGKVKYNSRADISAAFAELATYGKTKVEYGERIVTVLSPEVATLLVEHKTTVASDRGEFSFSGLLTITLLKTGEDWKFVSGHTSTVRQREESPRDRQPADRAR